MKAGDREAARKLWERYADRLIGLARQRLAGRGKAASDEEDIAQSVFFSICRGAAAGRFKDITSRDELWWLLLAVTRQKIVSRHRRETAQKRNKGRVKTETELAQQQPFTLDSLVGSLPTAESIFHLQEEYEELLARLSDQRLQQVAVLRVEGYTVAEIADKLEVGTRGIERKLQLIRSIWSSSITFQT